MTFQKAAKEKREMVRRTRLLVPTQPTAESSNGASTLERNCAGQKTWSSHRIVIAVFI